MLAPYFSSVAWTPEVKRAMFTEMDKDAGGSVCADEFYEWMIESAQLEVSAEGVTKMKQYAARRSYLRALRAQASRAPCAQANEPRLRPRQKEGAHRGDHAARRAASSCARTRDRRDGRHLYETSEAGVRSVLERYYARIAHDPVHSAHHTPYNFMAFGSDARPAYGLHLFAVESTLARGICGTSPASSLPLSRTRLTSARGRTPGFQRPRRSSSRCPAGGRWPPTRAAA